MEEKLYYTRNESRVWLGKSLMGIFKCIGLIGTLIMLEIIAYKIEVVQFVLITYIVLLPFVFNVLCDLFELYPFDDVKRLRKILNKHPVLTIADNWILIDQYLGDNCKSIRIYYGVISGVEVTDSISGGRVLKILYRQNSKLTIDIDKLYISDDELDRLVYRIYDLSGLRVRDKAKEILG